MTELDELEQALGVAFSDKSLLQRALVHRSYLNEHPDFPLEDNERLEFLGDAVLGFVAGEYLYHRFPEMAEGPLTSLRSALVRRETLASYARQFELGRHLLMGLGESASGGRERPAVLCAAFEAVIGAIYLDRGLEAARRLLVPLMGPSATRTLQEQSDKDAKSRLQELAQSRLHHTPRYRTLSESGPDHDKRFTVQVTIGSSAYGEGTGASKQQAAQQAAQAALGRLEAELSERPTLLITGGSGYLGSHLARQARHAWRVVATYCRHPLELPACEMAQLDIRDGRAVAALVQALQPDVVIHTAFDASSPEVIVEGTRHVAAAATAAGAHLVHLSSDMVFDGESAPYAPADPPRPITPYGQAKAAAEQAVADLCPAAAIVRTSLIYGFDPLDPRTRWVVDSLRLGQPITLFTDEVRCPVWVEQLAAALLELAATRQGGVWHLAGPQPLSRFEFGARLARALALDPAGLTPGLSRDSGTVRPRNLTLDVRRSQEELHSPLWGVDQVLERLGRDSIPG